MFKDKFSTQATLDCHGGANGYLQRTVVADLRADCHSQTQGPVVRAMMRFAEERSGKPFNRTFIDAIDRGEESSASEYELYGNWAIRDLPPESIEHRPLKWYQPLNWSDPVARAYSRFTAFMAACRSYKQAVDMLQASGIGPIVKLQVFVLG